MDLHRRSRSKHTAGIQIPGIPVSIAELGATASKFPM